jgi:hypothetical protein
MRRLRLRRRWGVGADEVGADEVGADEVGQRRINVIEKHGKELFNEYIYICVKREKGKK